MTSIESRTTEIYNEILAEATVKAGQPVTGQESGQILAHARSEAEREQRRRRHWDHTGIRPAASRDGQPTADLLFYTGKDNGMVSVIPGTHNELRLLAAQIIAYLHVAEHPVLTDQDNAELLGLPSGTPELAASAVSRPRVLLADPGTDFDTAVARVKAEFAAP